MYEVMARRYRPAQFDEVVGQEHIAATLKNAIARDRVAHAYMFTGGHGCGKTTMARILAKSLVCQQGPTAHPCGVCPICMDVAGGRDSDVLEIDGASNNGIEQIRQLREQAAYVPTRARYKIYIIDEVHMLSDGAFNALLKTLEEPPRHVKFILATTDPHKVPDTILSRCQRFDFRLVPQGKLSEFFRRLASQEKASIADEALQAVAAFAGGSVRDGLVLLDQLLSFADGEVRREDVEAVRGVASAENVAGLFACIARSDAAAALAVVDEVASRGTNVGDFLDQLIAFGRDLMLLAAGGSREEITAFGPARESLFAIADETGLEKALLYLDVLTNARTRVRARALTNPLVALEMAVARLAGLGGIAPLSDILARLEAAGGTGGNAVPPPSPAQAAAAAPVREEAPPPSPPPQENSDRARLPEQPAPPPPATKISPPERPPEATAPTEMAVREAEPVVTDDQRPWDDDQIVVLPEMIRDAAPDEAKKDRHEEDASSPVPPEPPPAPVDNSLPMEAPASAPNSRNENRGDPSPAAPDPMDKPRADSPLTAEAVENAWSGVLDDLAAKHPADFRHVFRLSLAGIEDGEIVLTGTPTAIEALEDAHRLQRLRDTAGAVLGRPVAFRFAAGKARRETAPAGRDSEQAQYQLARHPAVDKVRSLFDGVIVDCQTAGPTDAGDGRDDDSDNE